LTHPVVYGGEEKTQMLSSLSTVQLTSTIYTCKSFGNLRSAIPQI